MIGGLRGTASRLAIAAGFCVMGVVIFAQKPARAADLGGDCCADLEERVAELEATTVRKGNKKVTVQIYGKVNEALLTWNDGAETNTYEVNNFMKSTRMGFKGTAKITGDWTAGYRLEWEFIRAKSSAVNQFNDDNASGDSLNVRWSQMYVANKKYGTLNWGLTATPKYDITKDTMEYISTEKGEGGGLSDTLVPDFRMNDAFFLREKGFNNAEGLSNGGNAWPGRTSLAAIAPTTSSTAPPAATASPITRRPARALAPNGAGSRTTSGAAPYATGTPIGPTLGCLPSARAMKISVTSACRTRAAAPPASSATSKNGPARPPSSTSRRACSSWAFGASQSGDTNVKGAFNGQGAPDMKSWNVQGGIQRKVDMPGAQQAWRNRPCGAAFPM